MEAPQTVKYRIPSIPTGCASAGDGISDEEILVLQPSLLQSLLTTATSGDPSRCPSTHGIQKTWSIPNGIVSSLQKKYRDRSGAQC